jgi:uncharacterized Zn finger protein
MSYFQENDNLSEYERNHLHELGCLPKKKVNLEQEFSLQTDKYINSCCESGDESTNNIFKRKMERVLIDCRECGFDKGYQVHKNHSTLAECDRCGHVCDIVES